MCDSEPGAQSKRFDPSSDEARIAQSLASQVHKGPLQDLRVLNAKLAELARQLPPDQHELAARLADLIVLTESVLRRLRRIISSPHSASDPDLFAQLNELCIVFRAESGIDCRMSISEEHTRFESAVADTIHRIVRELLREASKRGGVTSIQLSSGTHPDGSVFIHLEDDGVRLPVRTQRAKRFAGGEIGRLSMDHRLIQLGGHLQVDDDARLSATIVLPSRLVSR